jgi:hypothetical protein
MIRSLQIVRKKEQQHERDPRKREKDNQQETRHEILPAHRTLFLHATQRICQEIPVINPVVSFPAIQAVRRLAEAHGGENPEPIAGGTGNQ